MTTALRRLRWPVTALVVLGWWLLWPPATLLTPIMGLVVIGRIVRRLGRPTSAVGLLGQAPAGSSDRRSCGGRVTDAGRRSWPARSAVCCGATKGPVRMPIETTTEAKGPVPRLAAGRAFDVLAG